MKLFDISGEKLEAVGSNPFKLEKDIQSLIEYNVDELFELEFVKSELRINNFRFDTLCFDASNNSFVVIEYKKGHSYSVIDQGYSYLSTLLNNKSDFVLEYNETLGKTMKRDEVDWSQSRVIFISPSFSLYQKTSVNFKNLPFELWEVTRYKNGSLAMNHISTESDVDINSTIVDDDKSNVVKQVSKEVIRYDEDYHLYKSNNRPQSVVELYHKLKERVIGIAEGIDLRIAKQTIGFRQNKIFTDIIIYNKGLGVVLNLKKGELRDDLQKTEDLSNKGHWGNGEYRIWINSEEELDYALSLIKQAFIKQV
tara:strand:- start:70 stop:999 length:930 start_codon:yes stop_codon:yes gene_type:complete